MKKIGFVMLSCVMILGACGTGKTSNEGNIVNKTELEETQNIEHETEIEESQKVESNTETKNEEISSFDVELTLMQKILLNEEVFNDGEKLVDVSGLYDEGSTEDVRLLVVDLDHDGINEVILTYSPENVLILHESDGKVFGYIDTFRAYAPLYMDGTSEGADGANCIYFLGNVSFENNVYKQEYITTFVTENGVSRYYKNGTEYTGVEITEEEYNEIMSQYEMEKATMYKFTTENILEYVK